MIRPVQTDLFAVIGNPVKHSLSPVMMNAAFRSLGIPGTYVALETDDLGDDLPTLSKMGFRGLSVTLPHKLMAHRLAVCVDRTANEIGAVNTLRACREGWEGCNTDWEGAVRALKQDVELAGRSVLVLGAGGAARAVVYGLKREGATVTVSNRCVERGKLLSRNFHSDFIPLATLERDAEDRSFDIVVQCTSAGVEDGEPSSVVAESFFRPEMTVMDTIYRPRRTLFMQMAAKAGCRLVSGLEMLLRQGVAQLEWWLGITVPEEPGIRAMREALNEALDHEEGHQEN